MSGKDEEAPGKKFDRALIRRVLAFAAPYKAGFVRSLGLLVAVSALSLAAPYVVKNTLRDALPPGATLLDANDPESPRRQSLLWQGGALLALIAAATYFLRKAQIMTINRTGQRVVHDLRLAVYRHITSRSLRFFDRSPTGRLVTRVTSDVEALNEIFLSGLDMMFYDLFRIVLIIGALCAIDVRMALWTLAVVPLIAAWSWWFQKRARVLFREVRGKISAVNTRLTESVSGVRVVHAFRQENRIADRFDVENAALRDAHLETVRNYSLFYPGMESLTALGTAVILAAGDAYFRGGAIARDDLVFFWMLFNLFVEPLRQLADKFNVLQAALAAGERIFKVLDDDRTLPVAAVPLRLGDVRGEVRFEGVDFSYEPGKPALRGVTFSARRGETVAFVGPTGSGKTTIISLLLRFYDPDQGRVLLDGKDLRELDPSELRAAVGVVLQDVFLFAGTVRENLALDDPAIDDARLEAALKDVAADALVRRLGGLDAGLEERGAGLSTGEKQLLAFARTLAHDPRVLVLDEATANIDTESERIIQTALERLMEGRTVLVVAHRLSTIRKADRIIVVHKGEIRETGTHAELLAKGGVYARLHRLQFRETA